MMKIWFFMAMKVFMVVSIKKKDKHISLIFLLKY